MPAYLELKNNQKHPPSINCYMKRHVVTMLYVHTTWRRNDVTALPSTADVGILHAGNLQ